MATLDNIVNVNIQLNTLGVGRADFGTLLIIASAAGSNQKGSIITIQQPKDIPADANQLTKDVVRVALSQNPKPKQVKVAFVQDAEAVTAEDFNAILSADAGFYFVAVAAANQDQLNLAKAVEASTRILFLTMDGQDLNAVKKYQTNNLYRTAVVIGGANTGIALAVRGGGYPSGSETFALKTLAGVIAAKLPAQRETELLNANATIYTHYTDAIKLTRGGKVAGGEWIDVIRFRDWLRDVMQGNLIALMINRGKLPYTNQGIEQVANVMIKSLQEGVDAGGIVDWVETDEGLVRGFQVQTPRAEDVPFNTKASRELQVGFTAYLAGAIHAIEVNGSFTYQGNE